MWAPAPVMTQPMPNLQQASTNNTIVINNQTAAPTVQLPRPWSTGICAMCDDMSVCCCVYWCPTCAGSQLASDMGEGCCLPFCVTNWLVALRTKMRTQYNIQGTIMDDSTTICFCHLCVLCQMMRELKLMNAATVVGR
ncbi:cornifelin-like [Pomacea canaliculata]|uniref:cornifelin-like n=1 Tax=Pomacea canaliculata TaxID=400727 RepID=UPI000D73EC0F|nr:cornifelin-like [Pomacea canaliculata]XP_025091380.1 cornifelin-like [Pomacea canaliculata]